MLVFVGPTMFPAKLTVFHRYISKCCTWLSVDLIYNLTVAIRRRGSCQAVGRKFGALRQAGKSIKI
jgi:hypothetical protein